MCKDCGCGESDKKRRVGPAAAHPHRHGDVEHTHEHDHGHEHDHDHDEEPPAPVPASRTVEVQRNVLAHNDDLAAANRAWLAARGVTAINFISSPGAGKTLLLERTLERLRGRVACAVITGDQQTDNDARRLAGKGAPVHQIETGSACHLNAEQVQAALPEVVVAGTQLLFIENVGNLVCPAAFDLGESFKVALLSTTEGEDKPVKYPALFTLAQVVVLTKTDLIPHLDWDLAQCRRYLRQLRPGAFIFELSAKTGDGLDPWISYLASLAAPA